MICPRQVDMQPRVCTQQGRVHGFDCLDKFSCIPTTCDIRVPHLVIMGQSLDVLRVHVEAKLSQLLLMGVFHITSCLPQFFSLARCYRE